ncbi:MAG: GspE/PulE family protein [Thermodesulfobacteriota bacterium]|nr:GspE/PulE family protein [Thermodesulfobacteriota bacterium]
MKKDLEDGSTVTGAYDRGIGEILVREGLISNSQLEDAFRIQNRIGDYKPIGQILVDKKAITQRQLSFLLDHYRKRLKLGDVLLRLGAISDEGLEAALDYQKETGIRLGEALIELNLLTEKDMKQSLCTQLNIPFINLDSIIIDQSLERLINRRYAFKNQIVPIAKMGESLTIAMDDPTDLSLIEELEAATGLTINVVTSTRVAIQDAFARLYDEVDHTKQDIALELFEEDIDEPLQNSKYIESQQARKADMIVSEVINTGIKKSASDIHIEALDQRVTIRFRIDGVLHDLNLTGLQESINRNRKEIISRIKILAKLDIAERRRPQDGSFRACIIKDGKATKVDFRISIVPGYYGENAVIRILDARKAPTSIEQLGFSQRINDSLSSLMMRNAGIILATGPTGSGKSTTLYGMLMTLYRPGIKILTAEDPIEYVYDGITQCEVNTRIGNTFAKYIRAFLRQDPEVIMIGEIRDSETAEMAFRAAQTGHIVLSTLHTNDAISSIVRLLDLKVDPSLIGSCLMGVISQRLVRQVCWKCKAEYLPSKELLKEFFDDPPTDIKWQKGQKCSHCNHTGYSGRFAVLELWTPSDRDILLINKGASIDELRESSIENTLFMSQDAIEKVREGKTNLEELIRTLPYSSIYQFRRFIARS